MNSFMGQYSHSIDAKGRLIVPAKFREDLGENFTVTRGLDNCLFVFPSRDWDELYEKISKLGITNANARKFARFLLGSAVVCEVDKQGRVMIPPHLREFAKLEKDVALVGVGNRIEIWNSEAWEEASNYDNMEEIAENMEGLGI